jgi:predicted TIM-barrel fold metal-dependent hydrolase
MIRALFVLALLLAAGPAAAADYTGPLIDAHAHVPSVAALDAYAEAARRNDVRRVVLLGVGGVQKQDAEWIAAAAKKYPELVQPGVPVAEPTRGATAGELDVELARTKARVMGEVHLRHAGRHIDRNPTDEAFLRILELSAVRGVPVVVHHELASPQAAASLEKALAAHPKAVVVLAHAGDAAPATLEPLLGRNANLMVDLSGMHFQRKPALASEKGRLDRRWKDLISKLPDRFLIGTDVWDARLFEPAMLDRLFAWTRRILGELPPDVAERVAYRNAAALYHID